ncbi:DNA mismatch repair endonuclease MutL [Candidatus Peregrinibacteria bacterium]|nr:DNA mismatch repair endonuclease MutL [Candidatus Peregrinibacteria bacterium]
MSLIKILPENLINQIAAGEVVERPASVVKELIENSVDAGADKITLEVVGGGDELIRVTDNGTGMDKDDARLALARHATSKISGAYDLFNIKTMGFRGEALASIASVSYLTLITRHKGSTTGTKITMQGGVKDKIEEISCPEGTRIEVKNLFFNTPARKKYLKTITTEYQQILGCYQSLALANPGIHFVLFHNDKESFNYPRVNNFFERLRDVLGKNIADNCVPISLSEPDFVVEGFIGKPEIAREGSRHQHLFVNGRAINNYNFSYALYEAYHSLLFGKQKPFFALNIRISPELIDVNIHPRKLEIKFLNQAQIFKGLQKAARESLEKNILMPEIKTDVYKPKFFDPLKVNDALEFTKHLAEDSRFYKPAKLNKYAYTKNETQDLSLNPLAQIAKSYILAENASGLVLIDQHAAHERVLYEELMDDYEKKSPQKQQLLIPQNIELSTLEAEIFRSNEPVFTALGFDIELFGGNTFIISSVPASIAGENIENILLNVLSDLSDDKKTRAITTHAEKIIEYIACRSAIKFGKDLSLDEMAALIIQLDRLKRPYTCPHGRPSMIQLTFEELEKKFKRI